MYALAQSFGCNTETLPFTYPGLPMGTTKPKIEDFLPLVERIDRRLSGTSSMLSYGGRLVVVKSVINAIPTYAMCANMLPLSIIDHVEKVSRRFLWSGKDINKHGHA